jgi:hypothetical protein
MPDYIRSQNPWLAAAESMQGVANPLMKLYTQLPQVRAQMQQHADQMGIQQGRLDLDQQEFGAKVPVYNAQAANFNAGAGLDKQKTLNLEQLLSFAMQGAQADTNPLTRNMTGAALLDPGSAQQMRNDVTKPMMLNQNETAFSNPQMGPPAMLAQGMVNSPFGNTVMQGAPAGTNQPPVIQQGQFRAPGSTSLDPSTVGKNWASVLQTLSEQDLPEEQLNPFVQLIMQLTKGQQATGGGQQVQTNRPVIKSIKQIK